MKVWTISILLLIFIALTIPLVMADGQGSLYKGKPKTMAKVEKRTDPLIGFKKLLGVEEHSNVDIIINGKHVATIPDNSFIIDIPISEECVNEFQYATLNWYLCEVT